MTATAINHDALKGATHPLRSRFLELFDRADGDLTPKGLAEETGAPLGLSAYHVRMLAMYGLVEHTRSEPRRGALQHFYTITDAGRTARRAARAATGGTNECVGISPKVVQLLRDGAEAALRASAHFHQLERKGENAYDWANREADRLIDELTGTLRREARA
jgi:DNA-binding PadR family transcriptional regulator